MRILVTAFEPFGNCQTNSSEQVLRQLPDTIRDSIVHKMLLPVSFRRCLDPIEEYLTTEKADLIVALGQAARRPDISVECQAVNIADAKTPDNDGCRPVMTSIIETGPASYRSRLPVEDLCAAIKATGVPCHLSDSAGRYVCNTLYYRLLHTLPTLPSVFIHLPAINPSQAGEPFTQTSSLTLPTLTKAIETLIATTVRRLLS